MIIFYLLLVLLLFSGYKSNNPLVRALCVVLSLVVASPLVIVIVHQWFIYTTIMLFLRGILVIVVYFSSLRTYSFKVVVGGNLILIIGLIFYPFIMLHFSNTNIGVIFTPINLIILLFILSSLLILINFTRYILSRGGAIRRF